MTRTIDGTLAASLASGETNLSRCLRLDLLDGTSIGITDYDLDLSVNLGDGALTYSADTGAIPSAIQLSLGLEADNFELRGPLTALITQAAILGGRFDRARARVFDVDQDFPTHFMRIMGGKVSGPRIEAGEFVLEVRSSADAFNQTIGRVLSPVCSYDLGDTRCQVDMTPFTFPATVATVTDDMTFSVTYTGATPTANQLRFGKAQFITGALAGTRPVEVFSEAAGAVELYVPLVEAPQVGDTLTLKAGCDKARSGDCLTTYNNAINFGGFPDGPGSPAYIKYPIPGTTA